MVKQRTQPTELEALSAEGAQLREALKAHLVGKSLSIDTFLLLTHSKAMRDILVAKGIITADEWAIATARAYRDIMADMLQTAEEQALAAAKRQEPRKPQLALPPGARGKLAVVKH